MPDRAAFERLLAEELERLAGPVLGVCPGTGANEGWTYVYQQTSGDGGGFRDGSTIRGMIYQGDPPPRETAAE